MFKKICSVLSTILLIVLAIVAALLLVPRFIGYTQYAVLSGSMAPGIPVGSIVYDKVVTSYEFEVGDIVTYQIGEGTLVTHRIVEIDEANQALTTKGDANETNDGSPVAFSQVVGVYGFHVPYLGYISIYGKTPLGIGAVCGLLVVLILLNYLPDALSGEDEKKEDEKSEEIEK